MDRFARAARCIRRPLGVLRSAGSNPVRSRAAGSLASAALLALLPLGPASWLTAANATDPSSSATASPSPKREVTATPSPSGTAVPKSTAAPSQGADTANGDDVRHREYWLNEYGITSLWSQATGKGVTVAVIDTGVDGNHPDLAGNVLRGTDVSGVGSEDGWQGLGAEPMHGTEVASLIAGHGHDTQGYSAIAGQPGKPTGMIGVAPDAKILPISLNMGTTGGKSIDEQIPAAVRYAVDHGAQIINMSIGSNKTSWPQSWDDAFAYAEQKGVLIVAAAGNRGSGLTQVGAPATIPGVLTVGGVDRKKQVSEGSSTQGISIAVVAPSTDMIAAAPGNGYMLWSGSSAAAPLAHGDGESAGFDVGVDCGAPQAPGERTVAQRFRARARRGREHREAGGPGREPPAGGPWLVAAGHCGCAPGVGHDYYRRCGASSASDARAGRRRGPSGGDRGARAGASRGGARAASASPASPARRFVVVARDGPAGLHFLPGGGAANAGPLYFLP